MKSTLSKRCQHTLKEEEEESKKVRCFQQNQTKGELILFATNFSGSLPCFFPHCFSVSLLPAQTPPNCPPCVRQVVLKKDSGRRYDKHVGHIVGTLLVLNLKVRSYPTKRAYLFEHFSLLIISVQQQGM